MLSQIWIGLPLDIVCVVIRHVENQVDLDTWIAAGSGNSAVWKTAVSERWRALSINETNLIGLSEGTTSDSSSATSTNLIDDLTAKYHGRSQASFVQHLTLDFSISWFHHDDKTGPRKQQIRQTLEFLVPHLTDLHTATVTGAAPQDILDAFTSAELPSLHTLQFQLIAHDKCFQHLDDEDGDDGLLDLYTNQPPYDWTGLVRLQNLRSLGITVRNLYSDDSERQPSEGQEIDDPAARLARILCSLPELKRLTINSGHSTNVDSILSLLSAIFLSQGRKVSQPQLPQSLEFLKLVIHDHLLFNQRTNLGVSQPGHRLWNTATHNCVACILPQLTEAAFHINSHRMVQELLACLSISPLSNIEILGSSAQVLLAVNESPEILNRDLTHINKVLTQYKPDQLVLTGAWTTQQALANKLNRNWKDEYTVTDLVLGTKSPLEYVAPSRQELEQLHTLVNEFSIHNLWNTFLGFSHGYDEKYRTRWGTLLERVQLNDVDPRFFDPSGIESPQFRHVRVLILCPFALPLEMSQPSTPGAFDSYPEGRLAQVIAQKARNSLRIVVIGMHMFWLEHPGFDKNSTITTAVKTSQSVEEPQNDNQSVDTPTPSPSKLWRLSDARDRPEQAALIEGLISPLDWEFVRKAHNWEPKPAFGSRIVIDKYQPLIYGHVSEESFKMWNYMVVRKNTGVERRNW